MASIRDPESFFTCSGVSCSDDEGFLRRTMTVKGTRVVTDDIFDDERRYEIKYREVSDEGADTSEAVEERVCALLSHPLQVEFYRRRIADAGRVHWKLPRELPINLVEAFVVKAASLDAPLPTNIGYGISSDPITECSRSSLAAAMDVVIREPWKVIDVKEDCELKDCEGHFERWTTLIGNGQRVREHITVNEEQGEVAFVVVDDADVPSGVQRVLAIRDAPLRLEFFKREGEQRVNWQVTYESARDTIDAIVVIAKAIEVENSGES